MDPVLVVLRVVHVVGGVFWAGAVLFVVHFLEPAVRDAGPDGAKVGPALQKRRYLAHPGPGASGPELVLGGRVAGRWVAALLGIAIVCTAVGRYA